MARFTYNAAGQAAMVQDHYGPIIKIRLPQKNGITVTYEPVPPATQFVDGEDIGHDITDERALRIMRTDPRFEEII